MTNLRWPMLPMLPMLLISLSASAAPPTAQVGPPECRFANLLGRADDTAVWSGACNNGYADGPGFIQWSHGNQPAARYEGLLVQGRASGAGIYENADGDLFQGQFVAGEREGQGILQMKKGHKLVASYHQDQPVGEVTMYYRSGNLYQGAWRDNHPDGQGTMTYAKGGVYRGAWRDGKPDGLGVIIYPNGIERAGQFHQGLREGQTAAPVTGPHYALKTLEPKVGTRFTEDIATGSTVPYDRSYADLTAEQQRLVRAEYSILQDDDVPPYPAYGPHELLRAFSKTGNMPHPPGELSVDVLIDPSGKPLSAQVRATPDKDIGELFGKMLMVQKYTPARCAGQPCAMRYSLDLMLHTRL